MRASSARFSFLLLISFIEGASVMAVELMSAKIVAPFYGASLPVWTSVIAITLIGLTAGYFAGGLFADKYPDKNFLFMVLLAGAFFVGYMPFTAPRLMDAMYGMGLHAGVITSASLFLFPPMLLFGMISPILIRTLTQEKESIGKNSGLIYAVSTVGGIFSTFLTGFYLIPRFGIKIPLLFVAGIFGIIPVTFYLIKKKIPFITISIILIGSILFFSLQKKKVPDNLEFAPKVVYKSEGLLGQIIVADIPLHWGNLYIDRRLLLLNRIGQTNMDKSQERSLWPYAHYLSTIASIQPAGSKALLLGLAGGSIVNEFQRLGFSVTAIELDRRMPEIAKRYFQLNPECKIILDDARHYIRTADQKYDLVTFDVFNGENQPTHVLTKEGFAELKKILNTNGMIIINFHGFISGKRGISSRSVFKTLQESGFYTELSATPGDENESNLLFIAMTNPINLSDTSLYHQNLCCKIFQTPVPIPLRTAPDINDAVTLSDDKPIMDVFNIKPNESWRKYAVEHHTRELMKYGIPLFY